MSLLGEEYATIEDAFSGKSIYDQYLAFQNKDKEAETEKLQEEKESSFLKQFGRTLKEANLVEVTNVPITSQIYFIDSKKNEFRYDRQNGKWVVTAFITNTPVENPFSDEPLQEPKSEINSEPKSENPKEE